MENASKALIIAGAILLAILLISLGILIFNQAQNTVNNSGMNEAEISSFNNKFLKYEKTNQPGSVVKALINEVMTTNQDGTHTAVTLNGAAVSATATSAVKTNQKYDIVLDYGTDGRVSNIHVYNAGTTTNAF